MTGFINVRQIADNLLDHPLLQNITLERIVNYTVEFIRIMGCNDLFIEKVKPVKIEEYRGLLPCDFIRLIGIRMKNGDGYKILKSSTDSFHMAGKMNFEGGPVTYKIQGRVLFLSIKDTEVEVSYQSLQLDEDGYPLVPDNQSFVKALELYIKKQMFTILFEMGQIHQYIYNDVCQEYLFYAAQAKNDMDMPDYDTMQNITRNSSILRMNLHDNGFKDLTI